MHNAWSMYGWNLYDFRRLYSLSGCHLWYWTWMRQPFQLAYFVQHTDRISVSYLFNLSSPNGLIENYLSLSYVTILALDRRADIQGIGAAGSGLGGLVLSNVTRVTLEKYGVRWSLIINGLISLVCLVPTVVLLKSRHKKVGSRVASFQLKWLVHPGYVWVLLWGSFSRMSSNPFVLILLKSRTVFPLRQTE